MSPTKPQDSFFVALDVFVMTVCTKTLCMHTRCDINVWSRRGPVDISQGRYVGLPRDG